MTSEAVRRRPLGNEGRLQVVDDAVHHGIGKDYIQYCRDLLKGKKELTPDQVIKMKIDGI